HFFAHVSQSIGHALSLSSFIPSSLMSVGFLTLDPCRQRAPKPLNPKGCSTAFRFSKEPVTDASRTTHCSSSPAPTCISRRASRGSVNSFCVNLASWGEKRAYLPQGRQLREEGREVPHQPSVPSPCG